MQALEKISREQPLVCLHGGAIMAVLGFIDFFSTSVQVGSMENYSCQHLVFLFYSFTSFGSIFSFFGMEDLILASLVSLLESCTFNSGQYMQETTNRMSLSLLGCCSNIMQSSAVWGSTGMTIWNDFKRLIVCLFVHSFWSYKSIILCQFLARWKCGYLLDKNSRACK